jgi:hypothetical protein
MPIGTPHQTRANPTAPSLAWRRACDLAVDRCYREIPTGRVGRYVGLAEAPALDHLGISTAILVFRCVVTGQMYSCSQLEQRRGVAYEAVDR